MPGYIRVTIYCCPFSLFPEILAEFVFVVDSVKHEYFQTPATAATVTFA